MRIIQVKIKCGKTVCGKCEFLSWSGDCGMFDETLDRASVVNRYYRCERCLKAEAVESKKI
jgi:hypothetical protein